MELDEYKQLYKDKGSATTDAHSAGELEGYMRNKTFSITSKIKRSILLEFAFCFIFIGISAWAWFRYPAGYVRPFAMITIALCCILFIYLGSLYKKIIRYEKSLPAVKDSLQQVIAIIKEFTRLYFQFTMITLPVIFIFGLIAGYLSVAGDPGIKNFNWLRGMLFYTAWFIIWWVVMYFFTKWYIKKLYGNYLQQLQQQLKDIENS